MILDFYSFSLFSQVAFFIDKSMQNKVVCGWNSVAFLNRNPYLIVVWLDEDQRMNTLETHVWIRLEVYVRDFTYGNEWNEIDLEAREVEKVNGTESTLGWFQTN